MATDSEEVERVLQSLASENSAANLHTADEGDPDPDKDKVEELLRQLEQEKASDENGETPDVLDNDIAPPKTKAPKRSPVKKPNGKAEDKPAPPKKKAPGDELPKPWKKKSAVRKRIDDEIDVMIGGSPASDVSLTDSSQNTPKSPSFDLLPEDPIPSKNSNNVIISAPRTPPKQTEFESSQHIDNGMSRANSSPKEDGVKIQVSSPSITKTKEDGIQVSSPSTPKALGDGIQVSSPSTPKTESILSPTIDATRSLPNSSLPPFTPSSSTTPIAPTTKLDTIQALQNHVTSTPQGNSVHKTQEQLDDVLMDDGIDEDKPVFSKHEFEKLRSQTLKQANEEQAILAQEFQELKLKYEEEGRGKLRLKTLLSEYENTIAKLIDEAGMASHNEGLAQRVTELENETKRKTSEYEAIVSAHNELKSRYEDIKAQGEKLKSSEQVAKEKISRLENELQGQETRFNVFKLHAESKLDSASEQLVKFRDESAKEISLLQTKVQKAENKASAFEKENKELLSICDDLMVKLEKKG